MTRAWLLLVVSSEGQRESLDDYLAMAREDAQRQGWTLERLADFRDVSSGKIGPRSLVVKLLAALSALPPVSRPAWVWMRRTDRIGRGRAADSTLVLHKIRDLGVRIWDHDRGEIRLQTAADEIIENIMGGLSRLENEVRRGKAVEKYRARRDAGVVVGNRPPYGLAITPQRAYVAQQPQAKAVALAFRLAAEGHGCGAIGRRLNDLAPPAVYRDHEYLVHWANNRVLRLLRNRAYVGPIVDEVTFARVLRVQAGRIRPSRALKYPWPLSGALRCYCGRSMNGSIEDGKYRYYACRAFWIHKKRRRIVKAADIERAFVALLKRLPKDPALVRRLRESSSPIAPDLVESALREAGRAIADVTARRTKVWALYESDAVSADDVGARLAVLDEEQSELAARIETLEAQLGAATARTASHRDDMAALREASARWVRANEPRRRTIAHAVATMIGGLYVAEDKTLQIGTPIDPGAQQRRLGSTER